MLTVFPLEQNNSGVLGEAYALREGSSLLGAGNPLPISRGGERAAPRHSLSKKQKQTVSLELAKHSDSWTVEGHRGREGLMVGKGCDHQGSRKVWRSTSDPQNALHHPAPGVAGAVTSLHNTPPCQCLEQKGRSFKGHFSVCLRCGSNFGTNQVWIL